MNRLEYNTVLKTFRLEDSDFREQEIDGVIEKVARYKKLSINFDEKGYAVVNGKIPLEVANIIYNKYKDNEYGIRVNGGANDVSPYDWAVDDKYVAKTLYNENERISEYVKRCATENKKFERRVDKNKYINTYHIDTKEGLVIFLSELNDYYSRLNNEQEKFVSSEQIILAHINTTLLKQAKLNITTYQWMAQDEKNRDIFFSKIKEGTKTSFGRSFRLAIDTFDATINPFINENVELDDINNFKEKVNMTFYTYNKLNDKIRNNCAEAHIVDLNTGNVASYFRTMEGFSYKLMYKLAEGKNFTLIHYFSSDSFNEKENGEVIAVNYRGDNVNEKIDIRYNITKGLAGTTYGEKTQVTPEQKEYIYDQIIKAINLAETITIDNMKKDERVIKLTPNNNI